MNSETASKLKREEYKMGNGTLCLRVERDRVVVSSKDVAKAFDREHKNVLRDIRELNCSEEYRRLNFELTIQTVAMPKGATREDKFYLMTRDGFVLLVMGYKGDRAMRFKEAYIREFNRMEEELRNKSAFKVPTTFKDALLLAAKLEEERQTLEAINKEMAPKAAFYDAVAQSATTVDFGRAAKILNFAGIGRNKLFEFLRNAHILMPDNTPYQEYVDRGYFKVIEDCYESEDGETHVSFRTAAYQKGIGYIRRKLIEAGYSRNEQARQLMLFAGDSEDWA
jgi:anti-repressor protein